MGGEPMARATHKLLCRRIDDRFSFVYLDVDGSPQMAAAKFPAVSPTTNAPVAMGRRVIHAPLSILQ